MTAERVLHMIESGLLFGLVAWMVVLTTWSYGDSRAEAAREQEARVWRPVAAYAESLAARVENMGCYWWEPDLAPNVGVLRAVDIAADSLP